VEDRPRTLTELGRYRLLEEVGQGGMAVVWRGLDTTLNREVAVKVLHAHLASHAESRARLQREAHAVAKLRHENILEIFDYSGPESAESYIVTEFIHGRTLKGLLSEEHLRFPEVAEMITSEVCAALDHAHRSGIIHRDVKPENIMIRADGLIKLTDFGIAQIVDKERLTVTGQLLGSPAYMAPEHVEGRALDFRTDVFSVGILIYQLATSELPFRGKNPHEVLKRIAECKFPPPESINPAIGARLSKLIRRALAREPEKRFPDVRLLREELLSDLRDAGIDDPRKELRNFFANRQRFTQDFRGKLVAALTSRGQALAMEGKTALALELWGRALQYEPKSAVLRELIEALGRRNHIRRAARIIAAALTVVVGLWAGTRLIARHRQRVTLTRLSKFEGPSTPKLRIVTTPSSSSAVSGVVLDPTRVENPHATRLRALPIKKPATIVQVSTPPPRARLKRIVELVPTPKAVHIKLDGRDLGDFGPQLSRVELEPGPHTLLFESPFCFPRSVMVGSNESPEKLTARLKWKPAMLTIDSRPGGADVLVDGALLSRSHQSIPLSIPELSPDGRRLVHVKVFAPGYDSAEMKILLRANETKVATVSLRAVASP
jgi:predicted Ser/Thr protein kinase